MLLPPRAPRAGARRVPQGAQTSGRTQGRQARLPSWPSLTISLVQPLITPSGRVGHVASPEKA
jgi:hypothetical protein